MSEDTELPAVYRSLSVEGLEKMRSVYQGRMKNIHGPLLEIYAKRVGFIEQELRGRALPPEPVPE
jgi:hypothetical protein